MVEVRVRQENGVESAWIFRKPLPIAADVRPFLDESAVDEELEIVANDEMFRAGNASGGSAKLKFHREILSLNDLRRREKSGEQRRGANALDFSIINYREQRDKIQLFLENFLN